MSHCASPRLLCDWVLQCILKELMTQRNMLSFLFSLTPVASFGLEVTLELEMLTHQHFNCTIFILQMHEFI